MKKSNSNSDVIGEQCTTQKISVDTPIGKIEAAVVNDPNYPGVWISINGVQLVLAEYELPTGKHRIRVWNNQNPDDVSEYSQVIINNEWIQTDEYQFVKHVAPSQYRVIDISQIPDEDSDAGMHYYVRIISVDLIYFSEEEINEIVRTYGYTFKNGTLKVRGHSEAFPAHEQLIAECIAETSSPDEVDYLAICEDLSELKELLEREGIDHTIVATIGS